MKLKSLSILVMAALSAPVVVQAADSPNTFSANVSLTSDYRFRGISQTFKDPAVQGGFDYSHSSGFYLGTWASNVDPDFLAGSNMEWDMYGGYTFDLGPVAMNVGGLYYYYPGKDKTAYGFDPNTFEVYAGGTWKFLNIKYSHSTTKLFGIDDSKGSGYLEANATFDLPADVSLGLHVAKQYIAGNAGYKDPTDWKVSLSKEFGGFNFSLAYVDTNLSKADGSWTNSYSGETKYIAGSTGVFSISKSF